MESKMIYIMQYNWLEVYQFSTRDEKRLGVPGVGRSVQI
jgi:hypothetical protein